MHICEIRPPKAPGSKGDNGGQRYSGWTWQTANPYGRGVGCSQEVASWRDSKARQGGFW